MAFSPMIRSAVVGVLPDFLKRPLLSARGWLMRMRQGIVVSKANTKAFNALMLQAAEWRPDANAMLACFADDLLPNIDISAVTYNSEKWLPSFGEALRALEYPADRLHICFVDNGSTDKTRDRIQALVTDLKEGGIKAQLIEQANLGFGGGHNTGFSAGSSDFVLVTNVDLSFETNALRRIVSHALADVPEAAAWEMRQKPYEHPKVYDPLTGATNWNAHAAVLLRRSAFEKVGGYSDDLFMYGEDVEISYRLRAHNFILRYNPHAVVYHHTYDSPAEVKPVQVIGSAFANLYIRLRYGGLYDILMIGPLAAGLLILDHRFPGARMRHARSVGRLMLKVTKALRLNRSSQTTVAFPFSFLGYDVVRRGAFHQATRLPSDMPKVTIITRSYKGRETLLRQAMGSVANQTYPNIEHLITEDRGDTLESIVTEFATHVPHDVIHVSGNKVGRSDAGNMALARASGRFCIFLDDDDQFYCDHIETLVSALLANENARGAYSLAFDLPSRRVSVDAGAFEVKLPVTQDFMISPFDPQAMKTRNLFPIQAVLFERSLYHERGGFDDDLDVLEDWVLWQKYTYCTQFVHVAKTTSFYRTPWSAAAYVSRMKMFAANSTAAQIRMESWRAAWDEKPAKQ